MNPYVTDTNSHMNIKQIPPEYFTLPKESLSLIIVDIPQKK